MLTSSIGITALNLAGRRTTDYIVMMCDKQEAIKVARTLVIDSDGVFMLFHPNEDTPDIIDGPSFNAYALSLDANNYFSGIKTTVENLAKTSSFKYAAEFDDQRNLLGCPVFIAGLGREELKGIVALHDRSDTKKQVYVANIPEIFSASIISGYRY